MKSNTLQKRPPTAIKPAAAPSTLNSTKKAPQQPTPKLQSSVNRPGSAKPLSQPLMHTAKQLSQVSTSKEVDMGI